MPVLAAGSRRRSTRRDRDRAGNSRRATSAAAIDLIVIDVSGLTRLVGPAAVIGQELRRELTARGIRGHVAVAGTQTAAMLLAQTKPGLTVIAPGDEADALAALPLEVLEKFAELRRSERVPSFFASENSAIAAVSAFNRWGLKTLGELAALPPAELVARLGKPALAWQAMARGEDLRPLVPMLEEERFESSLDLEWPIEGLEPLSFVLTRLLEPLSTRLERRDRGAAVLHVILRLVVPGESDEIHARRLELPTPLRDVRTLRTRALLDLEAHPPAAGIDRVALAIEPTPGRIVQHTLFTRAHPTPEQISTLLARLHAVMGQDRVGAPATVDSYRPGAFAMAPFATDHDDHRRDRKERREDQYLCGTRRPRRLNGGRSHFHGLAAMPAAGAGARGRGSRRPSRARHHRSPRLCGRRGHRVRGPVADLRTLVGRRGRWGG